MGLLGTVVEAQRSMVQNNKTEKVFVVPLVLGYHFVLEAPFLIRQHLQIVGKEKYLDSTRDMGRSSRQLFRFVWKLFSQKTTITLSIGKPMDALGNFVDLEGRSIDARGKEVHIADYFKPLSTKFGVDTGGGANLPTNQDLQREAEYTKMLAARIVDRFYKDNFVLSSQIVAFTAFNIFKNHNEKLDLYNLLRLPADNYVFPIEDFTAAIDDMKTALEELAEKGRLKLSNEALLPAKELIADGIRNLGIYHANAPLMFNKSGDLESDDFSTLFYYHNHLENYGLTKRVKWDKFKMETIDVVKIV
jgi:glycerol-3-phosphate O-acyltransferase